MADYADEYGEPVTEDMPLRVREAYERIRRGVLLTLEERRHVVDALDEMHIGLNEDLY